MSAADYSFDCAHRDVKQITTDVAIDASVLRIGEEQVLLHYRAKLRRAVRPVPKGIKGIGGSQIHLGRQGCSIDIAALNFLDLVLTERNGRFPGPGSVPNFPFQPGNDTKDITAISN